MGQLKHLGAPLHVTEPSGAELEVAGGVDAARQTLGLHAGLDPADLSQVLGAQPALGPAQRVDELLEAPTQIAVPGTCPGTQQRLTLPQGRPAPVVLAVSCQRAAHDALAAFGPQIGVHLKGMGTRRGEEPDHLLSDSLGLLGGRGIIRTVAGLVDEQHVRVGGVPDLVASQTSHGDDGVAGKRRAPVPVGVGSGGDRLDAVALGDDQSGGDRQRPAQDRVGGVGEDGGGALRINGVQAVRQGGADLLAGTHSQDRLDRLERLLSQRGVIGAAEAAPAQDGGDLLRQCSGASGFELGVVVEPGDGLGELREALGGPVGA